MKKIILTFGLLVGVICGGMFFLTHSDTPDFENGMLIGYLTMIIALSTIFFATKQYRDKYNEGAINFGKSFQIGIGITLVAALVYVIFWEIYYTNFASDFTDQYVNYLKESLADKGKTVAEIESEMASTAEMMENYKNNRLMRNGYDGIRDYSRWFDHYFNIFLGIWEVVEEVREGWVLGVGYPM